MEMCTIELHRESQVFYRSVPFCLVLDGEDVGRVKDDEVLQFLAAPGPHELCVYRGRKCIGRRRFTVPDGQPVDYITLHTSPWSGKVSFSRGLKSRAPSRRPSGCLTALLVVLCIFIVILAVFVSCGSSSEPEKVGESGSSSQQQQQQSDSGPETFGVGDQVALDGVTVTLLGVTENAGRNYVSPSDGNVFVLCEFEIENNSSRDIASSTIISFECYIDGYSTALSLTAMMSSDDPQLDGTIAAGKKMKGVVGYEAPQDWSEIEVRFSPSFWGKEIIFEYKK